MSKKIANTDNVDTSGLYDATVAPVAKEDFSFGNELQLFSPFIKWHVGLNVVGKIVRKFISTSDLGGNKNTIELELLFPLEFVNPDGEVINLEAGDHVNVGQVAALSSAMTLPIDTKVAILCVGQKEMGKGKQPAWDFRVTYDRAR